MDTAARAWIRHATGARRVEPIRSLSFGTTSELTLVEADHRTLVLRRWDRPDRFEEHPDAVANEVRALAAGRAVLGGVVPEPIAADRSGHEAGYPAVLMTLVPGAPVVGDLDVRRLAEPPAALHQADLPSGLAAVRPWRDPEQFTAPTWTSAPDAWAILIDTVRGEEPDGPAVFLHGDYHPGNVLWSHGEISGIVDWPIASVGPAGVDVAHTRTNLALVDGVDAADQYLAAYRALVPSYRHDPRWDAADLLGFDDDFAGVLAFNAVGAHLEVSALRSRADGYAVSVARRS